MPESRYVLENHSRCVIFPNRFQDWLEEKEPEMWSAGDEMRRRGEAFAQQERVPFPVYSLKLKQRLLQEAAARRTHKAAASAESNFTKIVNKVERIRLQDESEDLNEEDRNGNVSGGGAEAAAATTKKKKGGGSLDLKLEDAENENNLR